LCVLAAFGTGRCVACPAVALVVVLLGQMISALVTRAGDARGRERARHRTVHTTNGDA